MIVMTYLKQFSMMPKTYFRKLTILVMTNLTSFWMMLDMLEKLSYDGDDLFGKVSDDAKDILEEIYTKCDDTFEKISYDKNLLEKVSDESEVIFKQAIHKIVLV